VYFTWPLDGMEILTNVPWCRCGLYMAPHSAWILEKLEPPGFLDKVCGNGKKMADNKQEFDIQEKQLVNACEMDQHGTSKQSPKICSVGSMMQYNPTCNLSNIPLPKI
jgi:hypothetical protein